MHRESTCRRELRSAVTNAVMRQRGTGIGLVNDGECGHSMGIGV
jgi:hypothetical protein